MEAEAEEAGSVTHTTWTNSKLGYTNLQEGYGTGRHKLHLGRTGHYPFHCFGPGGSFCWPFASAKVLPCCETAQMLPPLPSLTETAER